MLPRTGHFQSAIIANCLLQNCLINCAIADRKKDPLAIAERSVCKKIASKNCGPVHLQKIAPKNCGPVRLPKTAPINCRLMLLQLAIADQNCTYLNFIEKMVAMDRGQKRTPKKIAKEGLNWLPIMDDFCKNMMTQPSLCWRLPI